MNTFVEFRERYRAPALSVDDFGRDLAVSRLDVLQRAAAFYRADAAPTPRRDLVEGIRALLETARLTHQA